MKYIKLCIVKACRVILKIFYVLPIKNNRIYLSSNLGQSISCNPFYIYRYLKSHYPNKFEYIWEYTGETSDKEIFSVKPGTLRSIYYLLTSSVIISNDGLGSYIPKRSNQMFINTWHGGGAYKKSGVDFITDQHKVDLIINRICGEQTDVFLSGCHKFTEVMHGAKLVPQDRFLECGMPRNDLLMTGMDGEIVKKIKNRYGVQEKCRIILYAPTYRGEEKDAYFNSQIDVFKCLDAASQRFGGEWVFFTRKHHFLKGVSFEQGVDVSDYEDMQELLFAANIFITDYSSSMWDYALTEKPGFLFVPDLNQYSCERSFYTPPETWPFPLAKTNQMLEQLILLYDETQGKKKIEDHQEALGNCETGKAAEIVAERIIKKCYFEKG